MLRPSELKDDDFWSLLQASVSGDEGVVRALIARRPELVRKEYNYTPALHFAVREGHAVWCGSWRNRARISTTARTRFRNPW